MDTSPELDKLATALCAAQAEIENAVKDAKGNYGKYADLSSVIDACKPALNKHGLSFIQVYEPSEPSTLCLTTMLLHASGQWVRGTCLMPLGKQDPQGYGSATTYAKRYGLAALVGLRTEDDDGQRATDNANRAAPQAERADRPRIPAAPTNGNGTSVGVWAGPGQCPGCNAPAGKRHMPRCGQGAAPAAIEDRLANEFPDGELLDVPAAHRSGPAH